MRQANIFYHLFHLLILSWFSHALETAVEVEMLLHSKAEIIDALMI